MNGTWKAILLGGLVAGTIDIGSAAVIYWVNPVLVLHSIASGLLGQAALTGGNEVAVAGLLLQWAMSLIIAAIYVAASSRLRVLSQMWAAAGLAYGVAIFFVMNYAVVPLSRAMAKPHFPHFSAAHFIENMLAMLLFGLIVAYFAREFARPTASVLRMPASS
jgi:hypothetical protein